MQKIEEIIEDRRFLLVLLLMNIAGVIAGFDFYYPQMISQPLWKMLFVPDCPLAALLFCIFLVFVLTKRRKGALGALAFTSLIKYGFWTIFIFSVYPAEYIYWDPPYYLAVTAFHLLMMVEAYVIIHFQRFDTNDVLLSLAVLLANDVMDYYFGTVPLFPIEHMEMVRAVSFISTFLVCAEALRFTKDAELLSARSRQNPL